MEKINEYVSVGYDVNNHEVGFRINARPGQYIIHLYKDQRVDLNFVPIVVKNAYKAIKLAYDKVDEFYVLPSRLNDAHYRD